MEMKRQSSIRVLQNLKGAAIYAALIGTSVLAGSMALLVAGCRGVRQAERLGSAEAPAFVAKAVFTYTDGRTVEKPLAVTDQPDGGRRVTVKAAEAGPDVKWVEIFSDCAMANRGEPGFWLGARGVLGRFTRETGSWRCPRNWVVLPYFAMQTPRGSFIAVMEGMRFEFDLRLDVKKGIYTMFPRWRVGEIDGGAYDDMTVVFYGLTKEADYNEMAKVFRKWKFAHDPEMKTLKERIKERPHLAKLARSVAVRQMLAAKPFDRVTDSIDFTPETEHPVRCVHSIDDTLESLKKMKAMGMDDIAMCVAGWQTGGYDGRAPAVFPVEPVAGGEVGLKRLIKGGQEIGYIMDAQDNYTDCYTVSPLWNGGDIACQGPDGTLETNGSWCGGRAYNLCLKNAWEAGFMPRDLRRTAALGFWGSHYIDVFTAAIPYRCCNPKHAATRREQMDYQVKVAKLCQNLFGGFSSECCFDHLLAYTDYINYATREIKTHRELAKDGKQPLTDKIVPFFELAFHDCVLSNPDKVTQEVLQQPENLILVEFGGRSIFYHIGDDNIPGIKEAYDQFLKLRHLQLEEMVSHKELAPGFVRVFYGNGEKIYVNHTDEAKSVDGVTVAARDFKLIKP